MTRNGRPDRATTHIHRFINSCCQNNQPNPWRRSTLPCPHATSHPPPASSPLDYKIVTHVTPITCCPSATSPNPLCLDALNQPHRPTCIHASTPCLREPQQQSHHHQQQQHHHHQQEWDCQRDCQQQPSFLVQPFLCPRSSLTATSKPPLVFCSRPRAPRRPGGNRDEKNIKR